MTPTAEQSSFQVRLEPRPSSVAAARRLVRDLLAGSDRAELLEPAELVVSEVVTNALLHAGTAIELSAHLDDGGVLVEVGDGSSHLPSPRQYAATSGTGRGLMMLESLVDDWGVTRHDDGKTVWFRVTDAEAADPHTSMTTPTGSVEPPHRDAEVTVVFAHMPLLLHGAWQVHAETLLREYLLASMADPRVDSIQMHADATDAIAILEEHVPRTRVSFDVEALMREVTEPLVTADRVEVPVPRASLAHFETLDRALEIAIEMSEEGLVLTPPTQPEMQVFRRWVCQEVRRQAGGAAPVPWTSSGPDRHAAMLPEGFDPAVVTTATDAIVAANDASQIVAVSRPAAELLGYGPEDLVGERIVAIVPERFRQAHVAGFTMYVLIDRRPLLGHAVRVPVLRRDGSEIEVELLVREQNLGHGPSVLLAELREV